MRNSILKKMTAIFCLVSVSAYCSNGYRYDKDDEWPGDHYTKVNDSLVRIPQNYDQRVINSADTQSFSSQLNVKSKVNPLALDWTKAPNSYIFDPNQEYAGLLIPVRKAYAMWEDDKYLGSEGIPEGKLTADVLWEDVPGLIISGGNYALEVLDTGQNAKIKVPVNKSKEGNAVIAFRINGEIFWSWHVWVTDDPTNGSAYKSFETIKRQRNDGVIEQIPGGGWIGI